jgi:8-oxo-dGTP diphosphatase
MARTSLERYPRPSVAVDVVVLTVDPSVARPRLLVLVQDRDRPEGVGLPGRFLRPGQTIADAVQQTLADKVGIEVPRGRAPHLLRIFDDPDRDDRGWTISAAHSLSLPYDVLASAQGRLVPVRRRGDIGEQLLFDHNAMVRAAVAALRERYELRDKVTARPDPDRFVPAPFALSDLRRVHEAVLGAEIQKDNFNRRVVEHLEPRLDRSGEPQMRREARGRPAQLYRHRRG